MAFRKTVFDTLKEKREKLSDSSAKTYTSMLFNLDKQMKGESTIAWFDKEDKQIIEHIEKMSSKQSQKTLLSALFVLTGNDKYKGIMTEVCSDVNKTYASGKLNEKQEANRLTFEQVTEVYHNLLSELKRNPCHDNYVNVLIVGLMSGVLISPRRNEWCYVKTSDYDVEKDNFIKAKIIYFNIYKTAKFMGQQQVKLPRELWPVYNKWMKINDSGYFLCNSKNKPFTSSTLNIRLGEIFGLKIGCDTLRSIYVNREGNLLEKAQEVAKEMGHSLQTQEHFYAKNG